MLLLHVTCYITPVHTPSDDVNSRVKGIIIFMILLNLFYSDYIILSYFCGVFSHVLLYCETRQIVIRKPDLHQEPNDTINIECQRRHSDTVRQHKTEDLS